MYDKFQRIVNGHIQKAYGSPPLNYKADIVVNGYHVSVFRVLSVVHTSDFMGNMGTVTHLTVAIPLAEQRMVMTRASSSVTVKLVTLYGTKTLLTQKLKGIVVGNRDPDAESTSMFNTGGDDRGFGVVTLELLSEALWELRLRPIDRIFQETDGLTAARSLLSETLPNKEMAAGNLYGLTYDEEEQVPYKSISIPPQEKFLTCFDYIQNRYGIYSKGLGVFQYSNVWYLFRPYDVDKFNQSQKRKLVVYNLSLEQAAHLDRTLDQQAGVSYVMCGGKSTALDFRDKGAMNEGSGYRVGSIRALDGRTSSFTSGGVSETTPDKFVSQVNQNPNASGLANAPVVKGGYKDDDKSIRSELARKTGQVVQVTWNKSMLGVVYPGQPVKFMYATDSGIYYRQGTVIGEVFHSGLDGGSMATPNFNSVTELTLWVADKKTD